MACNLMLVLCKIPLRHGRMFLDAVLQRSHSRQIWRLGRCFKDGSLGVGVSGGGVDLSSKLLKSEKAAELGLV